MSSPNSGDEKGSVRACIPVFSLAAQRVDLAVVPGTERIAREIPARKSVVANPLMNQCERGLTAGITEVGKKLGICVAMSWPL